METWLVRLDFPAHLFDVPIINQLIRRYEVTFNIQSAHIDRNGGQVEIYLTGSPQVLQAAIEWLDGRGITTHTLEQRKV